MRLKSYPSWLLAVAFMTAVCLGQRLVEWIHSKTNDPLHGTSFEEYRLKGKFLVPPQHGTLDAPDLVVHCAPGSRLRGHVHGSFVDGYINVGAVVETKVGEHANVYVPVEIKLDDRKLQHDAWLNSTDHKAIYIPKQMFCGDCTLANLFYGHEMPHKENTSPQIRRVMLGVDEYLAAEIEMQFDLPDVTQVADDCGIILHKR